MDAADPRKDQAVTILIRKRRFHGAYEIDGRFIVVRSVHGELRTHLGIQNERKLARKLLRKICTRAETATPESRPAAAE